MRRVNAIVRHPVYRKCYSRLVELEKDRIYCRHQMDHLLDVARIAYILNMEQGLGIGKEVIYAAALLHDIGKSAQYEEKIPHEEAGEAIASGILDSLSGDLCFSDREKKEILTAIRGHRRLREDPEPLEYLLYTSDKASRRCFACAAQEQCDWSTEKKNREIII